MKNGLVRSSNFGKGEVHTTHDRRLNGQSRFKSCFDYGWLKFSVPFLLVSIKLSLHTPFKGL